ncbi:DNA-binding protein WhiA, partial [Gulosibacter sediminis]|uniref:DNA-binding protein WhiA n=1 Tax=Gulosibacter sediminis TaxID=1729695 RepID=UPI0024AD8168
NRARAALISSILRFAGALQMISGRYVIEAELATETLAKRLAHELAAIYGVRPRIARSAGGAASDPHTYLGRVVDQGEWLARPTGLMDARVGIFRGLPNRLTLGTAD